MKMSLALLNKRRFAPIFVTQFLGAVNDNLFKFAMVILVVYNIYDDPDTETQFSALATGIFILPFFLFSAVSGQLADNNDKAKIVRIVKTAEIVIALTGALGLILESIPLMLLALFALGVQSTFFGPIKYAILPQQLKKDEVLGGTGLVEAGTYVAILLGTILGGVIINELGAEWASAIVITIALIGWYAGRQVLPAPPQKDPEPVDYNILRATRRVIGDIMHVAHLRHTIICISFFWTIAAVLTILFPPLVKNVLTSDPIVASLFLGVFSIGIAVGSILINRLLKGEVSARFSPFSVILMGGFVLILYFIALGWEGLPDGALFTLGTFMMLDNAWLVLGVLFGVAVAGGMFVVPLYAFLTTTVDPSMTARAIAANNVVNSGCMVLGSVVALVLSNFFTVTELLLVVVAMCATSAWLGFVLHRETKDPLPQPIQ
ncbi:MFS transporter [Parasphingopyxis sp.]|uniref:MFS transporter n=1 Tax=Parasphingopyxis sp. TaxID=1920299 RepID=UPI00263195AC|nr:MFS transporter [Parasphingopyxis sp.]